MSYTNELPKSRINITLNVEKNGSQKKIELPFKLLVLGKFSEQGERPLIGLRNRLNVNKENLNNILKKLSPTLTFTVPNHMNQKSSELKVNLKFRHYNDFRPENIAKQIAPLERLIAIRNLLKELKSQMIDNKSLQKVLSNIVIAQQKLLAKK